MSQQPRFFKKNYLDLDSSKVTITITDATATNTGQSFVNFLRNRNNTSGWMTTGSDDAALTEVLVEITDPIEIDTILLVNHNLKAYTIQYWDSVSETYKNFSTTISETTNTETTTAHYFDSVSTTKLKLVIQGTQTADVDKSISQLIATAKIESGQLVGWPEFQRPTIDYGKKKKEVLSGKIHVSQSTGAYKTKLVFRQWPESADIELLQSLFFRQYLGFLFWPCGGDADQFKYEVEGFRLKDIYHCKVVSEWNPSWNRAIYVNGINLKVDIEEAI